MMPSSLLSTPPITNFSDCLSSSSSSLDDDASSLPLVVLDVAMMASSTAKPFRSIGANPDAAVLVVDVSFNAAWPFDFDSTEHFLAPPSVALAALPRHSMRFQAVISILSERQPRH
eukprot:scaffold198785_cov14-Prasinocladus_malaysianus.AAC.1